MSHIGSAQVAFDIPGSNLVATVTSTVLSDVMVPTDVLTAVFFDRSLAE